MARFVVTNPYEDKQRAVLAPSRISNPYISGINPGGVIRDFLESQNYSQGVSGWRLRPDGIIEALGLQVSGQSILAGWNVDSEKIHTANAQINSNGYISFGSTPPTSYGNNVGAWLGFSSAQARFSLYHNSNNYLQWDGTKLLIRANNFTLDSSGNLTANAGSIGGWTIANNRLTSGNIEIDSGNSRILIKKSGSNKIVIEG